MNRKQQKALIVGGVLLALMALCPPWVQTFSLESTQTEVAIGYFPIFAPPKPMRDALAFGVKVDSTRWNTQLLVTTFLTGIAVVLLKESLPKE